jgi:lysophospholipase L1-like esterase
MSEHRVPRTRSAFLALMLAACSSGAPSNDGSTSPESAAPSETAEGLLLVAIGDSIPFNGPVDCPGCTGFVDSYSDALSSEVGQPVTPSNRSRHDGARTTDILEQLESDQNLRDELATADVIVMSVGFNDQPPFADSHEGCPPAVNEGVSLEAVVQAGAETSQECIESVVPIIRGQIAEVFGHLRELAPDAEIATLTAYDSWRGWPELDSMDPTAVDVLYANETYWFQQWNAAQCEEAEAAGAVCIDVYRAFNGSKGTEPAGELLAGDYTHPSQAGNDVIRDLLVDAGLAEGLGS